MKTIKNISERIATPQNFIEGYLNYVDQKPYRTDIRAFEKDLAANIRTQLRAIETGEWDVPPHEDRRIKEHGKIRMLGVYPCREHVIEWAILNIIEKQLTDSYIRNSCSCVKGRGQTDFIDILSRYMRNDLDGTRYGVQLDVHHYFPSIDHNIMSAALHKKIRDEKVVRMLDIILESYPNGLVLGTKLSQIEANFLLAPFDHQSFSLWGVKDDVEKMHYWRYRYVRGCIESVRTEEQKREVDKGIAYLGEKFDRLVEKGIYYARFADNIIMLCEDKMFLHLCTEIAIMGLTRDYRVAINKSWNVRPVEPEGIDVCGYVIYHEYRKVRKRNKQNTWREVLALRKKGLSPEEIRLRCASRLGWLTHGDCRNLLRKMNVNMDERLGSRIKKGRQKIPFDGMTIDQKRSIENFVCRINPELDPEGAAAEEAQKVILLLEMKIEPSPFEGKQERAALRFRVAGEDGWGEECYMWTGSVILINQAKEDFHDGILPAPTCIREYENKYKKKFFKFT